MLKNKNRNLPSLIRDIQSLDCGKEIVVGLLDGIAGVIPFGTILKSGFSAVVTLRDYHFFRKLEKFLTPLQDTSQEELKEFLDNLNCENERVSTYIYILLDRAEEQEKAEYMGKIYKAAVRGYIDKETMLRLSLIVSNSFVGDLSHLKKYLKEQDESCYLTNTFMQLGVIDFPMEGVWLNHPSYQLNELGEKLYNILNDKY